MLHGCGLRADFLYHLTYTLNLWDWATWEVVQYLVKPATAAHGRCRFVDLPFVKPYTGPATVFMSHCWGGRWGDLVAAACAGASVDRFVWIDTFAVSAAAEASSVVFGHLGACGLLMPQRSPPCVCFRYCCAPSRRALSFLALLRGAAGPFFARCGPSSEYT